GKDRAIASTGGKNVSIIETIGGGYLVLRIVHGQTEGDKARQVNRTLAESTRLVASDYRGSAACRLKFHADLGLLDCLETCRCRTTCPETIGLARQGDVSTK